MRYFFLLLLLLFLCTSGRAQNITISASIALAEDQCNPVINDPDTDCVNVPNGTDMLTYLPGQDGDIIVTYRLTNNSAGTIIQGQITDSDRGIIIPVTAVNIPPGTTVITNRIYPAETIPRLVTATVKANLENTTGASLTVEGEYTLDVVAPMLDVEFGVARQADVCDNTIAPNCNVPYGALDGQTITVGALDTFTTRYAWTNSGLSTFDIENLVDQDNFEIANTGFDQDPGQTLTSSRHWVAPGSPGSYNYSQTLTVTDFAGNTAVRTVTFRVIVQGPSVSVEFGVARQADVCDDEPIAPNCNVPYGALDGQFIAVGALDTFTTRYAWTNTGLGEYDLINVVDQDDFEIANTGFDQEPGQTLISSRHWVAPGTPGTYNFSQILTITDMGGNIVTRTVTYIVKVEAPTVSIQFGVANQNDVCPNETIAPNCPVPYGAANGQVVTVGAGDTLTTRYAWTNTGLGEYDLINVVDQDNFEIANTGFDQEPGQTLISSRHWEAPDSPGTYDWSQTLTITDMGGNVIVRTVTYQVIVNCNLIDLAPPTALCQDRTVNLRDGETAIINAGQIDDGSFDGCGQLAGGAIDISSFTCADEGVNIVTLTVGDLSGNSASCTSEVTVVVDDAIYEGPNNDCVSTSVAVAGGQAWHDITSLNGKIIGQVIIGSNTNIASVKASVYKSTNMTEDVNGQHYLSKRIDFKMVGPGGNQVQPNTEQIYVRLYYTEAELDALIAASPGANSSTFTIVKTSDTDCGNGYSGMNAAAMNTSFNGTGCAGEDAYFEFFTGTFSTFYLFAVDAILPVELTEFDAREVEKQRVQLNWQTTIETDNSHFEVEHSVDGRTFNVLGEVAGAGNSSEEQAYDYLHKAPVVGLNYYRLRQVDYDGTATLSDVREVNVSGVAALSLYPNPTTDALRINGFAGGPVRVMDHQGRTVLRLDLGEFGVLDVRDLPAGVYLVQTKNEALRFIKH